jgi:hypothetical protein
MSEYSEGTIGNTITGVYNTSTNYIQLSNDWNDYYVNNFYQEYAIAYGWKIQLKPKLNINIKIL